MQKKKNSFLRRKKGGGCLAISISPPEEKEGKKKLSRIPAERERERESIPRGGKKFPLSNKATKRNRRRKKVALSVIAEE